MRFATRKPSAILAPFVEGLWFHEGAHDHAFERILPTGKMQLLVNLAEDELRTWSLDPRVRPTAIEGAALSGPYAEPFVIHTREQRRVVGVSFAVGGAAMFSNIPCDELAGAHVSLGDVWKKDGTLVRERLLSAAETRNQPEDVLAELERVLTERLIDSGRGLGGWLARATAMLDRGATVSGVGEALGITEKRLLRLFGDTVGLTPKRYGRVRRFQRSLGLIGAARDRLSARALDWAQIALACGYFDQPHFNHEFRALSAMSPTAYAPRSPAELNHVPLDDLGEIYNP